MNLSNNAVQNFQLTSQSRKRIPQLVDEIKELQEEIESLTKEVEQLKKRPHIEHRIMGCSIQ